jgi:hypothetical protein
MANIGTQTVRYKTGGPYAVTSTSPSAPPSASTKTDGGGISIYTSFEGVTIGTGITWDDV